MSKLYFYQINYGGLQDGNKVWRRKVFKFFLKCLNNSIPLIAHFVFYKDKEGISKSGEEDFPHFCLEINLEKPKNGPPN